MRVLWILVFSSACCEVPFLTLPNQECDDPTDTGSTDSTDTGRAGTGEQVLLTGLDLSVPTGDDEYDRYTAAIWTMNELAQPVDGSYQILEGMAGLTDINTEMDAGLVYVEEVPTAPGDFQHFVEHWFMEGPPEQWFAGQELQIIAQPGKGWNDAALLLPVWNVADYTSSAYLCQDVLYTGVPAPSSLDEFDYIDREHVPARFEFDLVQDGQWVGSLLREQHMHDILGEVWVDFWNYGAEFDLVGEAFQKELLLELESRTGDTLTGFMPSQPPGVQFSRVIYKVLDGTAFDPEQASVSCDHAYEI